jgi:8-oxo-dGTP diphosphatase
MMEQIRHELAAEGNGEYEILLITRGKDPFKGHFAFPGGFVDYGEDPKNAVLRELKEECSVDGLDPKLVTVHGDPARDPRKHIVTIAYHVEIDPSASVKAGDDAATASWYNLRKIWNDPNFKMAFDHKDIMAEFLKQYPKL